MKKYLVSALVGAVGILAFTATNVTIDFLKRHPLKPFRNDSGPAG